MKVREAMQRLGTPLTVPDGQTAAGHGTGPGLVSLSGPVTREYDPQVLFSHESVAQALHQLEVYGHDGLPVLSPDGQQVLGWITSASVLRSVARRIDVSGQQGPANPARRRVGPGRSRGVPLRATQSPAWLPGARNHHPRRLPCRRPATGYRHLARRMGAGLRGAPRAAGSPDPALALAPGDRINLLAPRPPRTAADPGRRAGEGPGAPPGRHQEDLTDR